MGIRGFFTVRLTVWFMGWILFFSSAAFSAEPCQLGVYTYDSIAGHGGLGEKIFPAFEKLTGCKVRVLASGDAIQLLGRVEIDLKRGAPAADVILGVDSILWSRTEPLIDPRFSLPGALASQLDPEIDAARLSRFRGFVPYDFGALSLVGVDTSGMETSSLSLEDLNRPEWRKRLILEDPRTSSPGMQFLLFTKAVLGERFGEYWKKLRSQWLTMPPGWDAAYGLFLKGEAPFVWSYVTSEAYHREHASTRYHAVLFKEGQPVQIQGAVLVKGASHPELARKFLEFLLSHEVQSTIALTEWMLPAARGISLPKGFTELPKPAKKWILSDEGSDQVLKEWSQAIHDGVW